MLDRQTRHLILQFALKDFKIRYTHSLLGYAWSVLNPLVFTMIYFLVFSRFIRFNVPNYQCYLLLGIALWNFFAEGSSNGIHSLLARSGILGKVAMPRHIVIDAAVLNAFFTLLISLLVLGVFLWWSNTSLGWPLLVLPLFLFDLVLLTLGAGFLLAPVQVRFRDVGYLWGVALQVLFWLTPIIYLENDIPSRWKWLVVYNPVARIILYSRQVVIYSTWPDWVGVLKTSIASAMAAIIGWAAFSRLQVRVAEYFSA
jgi:ABC-type polysaccharide/polyol phosphate export permease